MFDERTRSLSRFLAERPCRSGAPALFHCAADWSYPPRVAPDFHLWRVLRGGADFSIAGSKRSAAPGSWALFCPGDPVQAVSTRRVPLEVLTLHFAPDPVTALAPVQFPRFFVLENPEVSRDFFGLAKAWAQTDIPREEANLSHQAFLTKLLGALLEEGLLSWVAPKELEPGLRKVQRALAYLEKRLESRTPITDIAEALAVERSTVTHLFRRHLGMAPAAWLRRRRLQRSRSFLEAGLSVTETARRCGFPDAFTYSKAFKACFGMAPREARRPGGASAVY